MSRVDPVRVWFLLTGGSALGDTLVWTVALRYGGGEPQLESLSQPAAAVS